MTTSIEERALGYVLSKAWEPKNLRALRRFIPRSDWHTLRAYTLGEVSKEDAVLSETVSNNIFLVSKQADVAHNILIRSLQRNGSLTRGLIRAVENPQGYGFKDYTFVGSLGDGFQARFAFYRALSEPLDLKHSVLAELCAFGEAYERAWKGFVERDPLHPEALEKAMQIQAYREVVHPFFNAQKFLLRGDAFIVNAMAATTPEQLNQLGAKYLPK